MRVSERPSVFVSASEGVCGFSSRVSKNQRIIFLAH